jgi:hypothetical protein
MMIAEWSVIVVTEGSRIRHESNELNKYTYTELQKRIDSCYTHRAPNKGFLES